MKKKLLFASIFVSMVLIVSTIVGPVQVAPVSANAPPTTSLTITKYAPDGTTVVAKLIVTAAQLETGQAFDYHGNTQSCPIQGDGVTEYYAQGPTFDPTNLADPNETVNLKDKGALKGTDLADLCSLVGGAGPDDTIQVLAADGYEDAPFFYKNVYNPDPAQGKMVICWYNADPEDGSPGYVPTYTNGMLLAFFAETTNAAGQHVFGNTDMEQCLPETDWHFYADVDASGNPVMYPDTDGLCVKWINQINIYQSPGPTWSLALSGAVNETISQSTFINGMATSCHGVSTYTDSSGTWGGLPLWRLVGYVDDQNVHGVGAFNDALAADGYTIQVTGADSSDNPVSTTLPSAAVARKDNIILAVELNGKPLTDDYPLKLVGPGLSDTQEIGKVSEIQLLDIPGLNTWTLALSGYQNINITQAMFEDGLTCHGAASYTDGSSGKWTGFPLWMLCGWVDNGVSDGIEHGAGAFDTALAANGYSVKIIGTTGTETFTSQQIASNSNYILANEYNGSDLSTSDPNYPLNLVGSGVSSSIGGITNIELINLPSIITVNPSQNGTITPSGTVYVRSGNTQTFTITPAIGFKVSDVQVDNVSVGAVPTYQFTGGAVNHTISATFAAVVVAPVWDLNDDHICNIGDVVVVGLHWEETGANGWIPEDLNYDGVINISDVVVLGLHWGQTW